MDVVRKLIVEKLTELRLTMSEVSNRLERNPTYLQQFLKKGSPRELPERERILLSEILKVPEDQLRGPSLPLAKRNYVKNISGGETFIDRTTRRAHNDQGAPHHQKQQFIPGAELYANMDLPVFGTAQGGDGALIITDRPVDYMARPSVLLRVQDGYGVIVTGDSMSPAHKSGSTALVNPHLPPRIDDACIFRCHADDGTVTVSIKEYRGQTETHWKVRQHNPPRDFTLKKSEWQICHRVVGSYFP